MTPQIPCWHPAFESYLEHCIGGNFAFQNGLGLTIKTVNSDSPWAYIWEGLLSEGYLHLIFGGLFSGGLIFGRAYYRNFTVFFLLSHAVNNSLLEIGVRSS